MLRWWTVLRLISHWNPSSTGESSTAKKEISVRSFKEIFGFQLFGLKVSCQEELWEHWPSSLQSDHTIINRKHHQSSPHETAFTKADTDVEVYSMDPRPKIWRQRRRQKPVVFFRLHDWRENLFVLLTVRLSLLGFGRRLSKKRWQNYRLFSSLLLSIWSTIVLEKYLINNLKSSLCSSSKIYTLGPWWWSSGSKFESRCLLIIYQCTKMYTPYFQSFTVGHVIHCNLFHLT